MSLPYDIQIISAPSILGLRPTGVERLGDSLLAAGLEKAIGHQHKILHVPAPVNQYSAVRDPHTQCLNPQSIRDFSLQLQPIIAATLQRKQFSLVLGGDCSIILGIMPALKKAADYGLLFVDAHADFYAPHQSPTGEVADMDLAMVTGRGPALLTDIDGLGPYVKDEHVIHIGQRDEKETQQYHAEDIQATAIHCFSLAAISEKGIEAVADSVTGLIHRLPVTGFWIHFDTDVLSDNVNPAVDYRLPGGLDLEQITYLLHTLLRTGKIAGLSITIFNPSLDHDGHIARQIVQCIDKAFS